MSLQRVPASVARLFFETDPRRLDVQHHADSVLARVLEQGTLTDVRWLVATYGMRRIHRFFREVGHPEITERTSSLWRAVFNAEDEVWASPPAWRKTNSAPWVR